MWSHLEVNDVIPLCTYREQLRLESKQLKRELKESQRRREEEQRQREREEREREGESSTHILRVREVEFLRGVRLLNLVHAVNSL